MTLPEAKLTTEGTILAVKMLLDDAGADTILRAVDPLLKKHGYRWANAAHIEELKRDLYNANYKLNELRALLGVTP